MSVKVSLRNVTVGLGGLGQNLIVPDMCMEFDGHNSACAIVGPSGIGKTTFMYILSGLKKPDAGKIRWIFRSESGRKEIVSGGGFLGNRRATVALHRKRISFLFQDSALLEQHTVGENLIFPLQLNGESWGSAYDSAKNIISALFHTNGDAKIDALLRKYPRQLSGGQLHRVGLAQALISGPNLLFADEPTSSLDDESREIVIDVLRKWLEMGGSKRGLVWVTHRRDEIEKIGAKQIIKLEEEERERENGKVLVKLVEHL